MSRIVIVCLVLSMLLGGCVQKNVEENNGKAFNIKEVLVKGLTSIQEKDYE